MKKHPSVAKITRPKAEGILPRKRLFRSLDGARDFPITWISGPPGSGKTSLVASYVEARNPGCLWYQVDERDADLASFFYYMGLAARKAAPRFRKPLPLLTQEYLAGIPAFTRNYFEKLYGRVIESPPSFLKARPRKQRNPKRFIIVLDNYQSVPLHSGFHEMIRHALDVTPEGVNVFVLSRNEPPPQLTRLIANHKVDFLHGNELALSVEETGEVLRMRGQKRLGHDLLVELHKKTEGWAAGVMLMALGPRIRMIDDHSITRIPLKEISDYFAVEIFEKMEKARRDFLTKTALFPGMTVRMAEELTGNPDSGQILSGLSESHYFTETYVEESPVYQYHPLFREFLLSRLQSGLASDELLSVRRSAASILENYGRVEDAFTLFRGVEDWPGMVRLVSNHAQALIAQGRNKTLEQWILSIPDEVRKKMPLLVYWLGVCKQPFHPGESRVLFEEAFQLFDQQEDTAGTLLAWSGAVDTIVFEWDNFTLLDHWIDWLDQRLKEESSFPSPEIEARVISSMAGALLYRRPDHPDIKQWIERASFLCRETGDADLCMKANLHAVNYYAWVGDLSNCNRVADEIRKIARHPTSSPLMVLTWKWIEALIFNRTTESSGLSLKSISEGLEIAEQNGVHVWDHMLLAQGVYASFNAGDRAGAGEFLKKMETLLERDRRHGQYQYHYLAAWYYLLSQDIPRASFHEETASRLVSETGMYFTKLQCSLLMAEVLHAQGDRPKAVRQLSAVKELIRRSGSLMLEYMCLIKEAQFSLDDGEDMELQKRGLEALRSSMELGRKQGYISLFPWWNRPAMTRICEKALREKIEVSYVREIIRTHHLVPENPPLDIDDWPWPLRFYTLGRFEFMKEGKPVRFSGKVQKKPLEMLKALIALGGREVTEAQMEEALWPDADGDAAHSAFSTTLSRLRQLLGIEGVIKLQEGRMTLDPCCCWVDCWSFERMARQAEVLWNRASKKDIGEAVRLTEKALNLHPGLFLPADEAHFWTIPCRERLRAIYLRLTIRLGSYLEETVSWERAEACYHRSLEVDPFAEEIYQHLMICHQRLGRYAEAIEIYRRLKKTLFSTLGIEPSPKTEAIYKSLIGNVRILRPNQPPQ